MQKFNRMHFSLLLSMSIIQITLSYPFPYCLTQDGPMPVKMAQAQNDGLYDASSSLGYAPEAMYPYGSMGAAPQMNLNGNVPLTRNFRSLSFPYEFMFADEGALQDAGSSWGSVPLPIAMIQQPIYSYPQQDKIIESPKSIDASNNQESAIPSQKSESETVAVPKDDENTSVKQNAESVGSEKCDDETSASSSVISDGEFQSSMVAMSQDQTSSNQSPSFKNSENDEKTGKPKSDDLEKEDVVGVSNPSNEKCDNDGEPQAEIISGQPEEIIAQKKEAEETDIKLESVKTADKQETEMPKRNEETELSTIITSTQVPASNFKRSVHPKLLAAKPAPKTHISRHTSS